MATNIKSNCCNHCVKTIANLKSFKKINDLKECPTVEVLGYHKANDGGGGMFFWDETFVEAGNDGTIIKVAKIVKGRFKRMFSGQVNVKWFGAKGDGTSDDTKAMQDAHDLGLIVYYPKGKYVFSSKITIKTGGIIGDGVNYSILVTTDKSNGDVILYTGGENPQGLLGREQGHIGGVFKSFGLMANHPAQKGAGAGIKIDPSKRTNPSEMLDNHFTTFEKIRISNIPTCIFATITSWMTIRGCYFDFYSQYGVLQDNDAKEFADNGDNMIADNWFFTINPYTYGNKPQDKTLVKLKNRALKEAVGIKSRSGGRFFGNKILGGAIGIDISPLRPTSNALISNNSIELQTRACIRYITEQDALDRLSPKDNQLFAQVFITSNQLHGNMLNYTLGEVATLLIAPENITLTELVIGNNIIRHYPSIRDSSRTKNCYAIDLRNTDNFTISANVLNGLDAAYSGGIFIDIGVRNGKITGNSINRFPQQILNNGINVQVI